MNTLADLNVAGPWDDQRAAVDVAIGLLGGVRSLHGTGSASGMLTPAVISVREDRSVLIGSPDPAMADTRYASPEVRNGLVPTPGDDCYSVGAMLYEMLAGYPPVTGQEGTAGSPGTVSQIRADVDPQLASIVGKAIADDPATRYQNADAFREDLIAVRPLLPEQVVTRRVEAVMVQPGPSPRRMSPVVAALLALLVVGLGLLLYLLLRGDDTTVVPSVAGEPVATAQRMLRESGLQTSLAQESSARTDPGIAIRTDPPAGAEVESGSTVVLVIDGDGAIPSVVGQQESAAVASLAQAGLRSTVTLVDDVAAAGTVVGQAPRAGQPAAPGSTVNLSVSTGPRATTVTRTVTTQTTKTTQTPPPVPAAVRVPSVVGQRLDAASRTITRAGLAVGTITRQPSANQSEGIVLQQTPAAGSQADTGSLVTLTVAAAPTP